jgi:23S rRNA (uracil1939-C5)-methyltransferase
MTIQPLQSRFKKGETIQVEIQDAAEVEKCFGRMPDGVGVFVRGMVAVGDRVEADVYKIKKNYLEARLTRILEPSPVRTTPGCPHFGMCGGCKWQHVTYEEQLRIKQKQVRDPLIHVGGFTDPKVREVLPAPVPFGYRNKVDFSFSNLRFLLPEETDVAPEELDKPVDFALGFHAPLRYNKAIDIDYCFLATPAMNQVLTTVRTFCLERGLSVYSTKTHQGFLRNLVVRQSEATGQVMVNLVTTWHDADAMKDLAKVLQDALRKNLGTFVNGVTDRKSLVAFGDTEHVLVGEGYITEQLGDFAYKISPNSFFQTNTRQALALYQQIVAGADLQPTDRVFDLYCGTGSIALFLSSHCRSVLGVEVIDSAIADARANAAANEVANCTFKKLDMKEFRGLAESLGKDEQPDVVVVDPPRAGMHPKAIKALRQLAPRRIVYVSCKPASLARDAQALCEDGAYTLGTVQPVDMFPHTNHIESVAVLDRAPTSSAS